MVRLMSDTQLVVMSMFIFVFFYWVGNHHALSQVNISTQRSDTVNFDEIQAEGVRCRQGLTSATKLELGVGQREEEEFLGQEYQNSGNGSGAVFGRITYQLGMPRRIDCSRLYDLQIMLLQERLRLLSE